MRRLQQILGTVMLVSVLCGAALWGSVPAWASEDGTPSLVISQAKITSSSGQFVTLFNSTDSPLDASHFQLEYFNSYDLDKATSSRVIGLSGILPPHGYLLLADDNLQLCHQQIINAVSLGFSSTSGLVTVQETVQTMPGGAIDSELQDYFAWSKTASSQVQTLPSVSNASLLRQPRDNEQRPLIDEPGGGSWLAVQPDDQNQCSYSTVSGTPAATTVISSTLLPSVEPPVTFRTAATFISGMTVSNNSGLRAPVINELLPNPSGTGTDKTQEFIEIYNPNNRSFGLNGYGLQVGLGRLRYYYFPAGTTLKPRSFTVFYSAKTKLSLSNTASQVSLVDPNEKTVTRSSIYQKAKDGISWSRANGKWYWSTVLTPGRANVISEPIKKTKRSKNTSRVKYGPGLVKGSANGPADSSPEGLFNQMAKSSPVHPAVLALVGGSALLYGAYEYRADLAGRFEQLRSKLSFGRRNR